MTESLLAADFQFSQASLQDYVDCPRRFQLRHIRRLAWPAVEAEPIARYEAHLRQGQAFHRLVQQEIMGVPQAQLARMAAAEGGLAPERGHLSTWWANYLAARPADLPGTRYPEITLSAPLQEMRLIAKYDLIVVQPGRHAVILDWKTSGKRPRRGWLASRLQTRVYRYLLVRAGGELNGGSPIAPEQVTMTYWFANFPDAAEHLPYDAVQFAADQAYLHDLIAEIKQLGEDDFPLTDDVRRCRFCPYRSLCGRGVEAGALEAIDDAGEPEPEIGGALDIDFEQISEITF